MLIGLNGKLKAGKDTTYSIIDELYPEGATRISFAAKLKQSASAALGITVDQLELLKNNENYRYMLFPVDNAWTLGIKGFSVREYLQRVGTEAGREVFGENFWVDMALPDDFDHRDGIYVVTDMRFPNEIDRVIELGGYTVRVNRFTETAHGGHPSEQNIADELIDWELDNTGDLEQLKINIVEMLEHFEGAYVNSG